MFSFLSVLSLLHPKNWVSFVWYGTLLVVLAVGFSWVSETGWFKASAGENVVVVTDKVNKAVKWAKLTKQVEPKTFSFIDVVKALPTYYSAFVNFVWKNGIPTAFTIGIVIVVYLVYKWWHTGVLP